MIELGLLAGLGALGYVLASQQTVKSKSTREHFYQDFVPDENGEESEKGHSNEVPHFGARLTQSMYSGATNSLLDHHIGAGKEYVQKQEVKSFFDSKPAVGNPFGAPNESDFMQSRMVTGQRMNNVFPVDSVQVGPGINDGYTNIPKGGFQQAEMRDYAMPKTTDELRVVGNEKVSYDLPTVAGAAIIKQPGLQAEVRKNKPDRFQVLGMDRANTAVGIQTAPKIYANQPMKEQMRESTSVHHVTTPGGSGVSSFTSYVRAFTEPYQNFVRLTAEGRPSPASTNGAGLSVGSESYTAQVKFDKDSILQGASRMNTGYQGGTTTTTQQMGSYRYNEPLNQNINVDRNSSDVLSALSSNPYAQKLNSY